jgi:hypothetical protein
MAGETGGGCMIRNCECSNCHGWQECEPLEELESKNAELKQLLADFVNDANKQTSEIVRLRVIIERANSINGDMRVKEILEEVNK